MFVLATISDVVRIAPHDLEKPPIWAIMDNIHTKYANKVLQKVGLCIRFWDLLKASDGLISPGDGMVNVNVVFRLIVFRPFKGEVIQGTIREATKDGIRVSVDLFDDIWVPEGRLMEGSRFSAADGVWVWEFDNTPYFYELNEQVRLRVEGEVWHDLTPEKETPPHLANSDVVVQKKVPYTIVGSMADNLLGCMFWWDEEEVTVNGNGVQTDAMQIDDTTAGATEG
ncbi:putative DNA-directed RNA polymerase III subunit 22.9 kDa [Microthyrium microscopicum]|uniref:DNA-directed RNA polymerase subunit n=1 Tax=Microthyrium microscopicum TaxID=703497 RepID=A0A6A6UTQ1_9PEZI|nr:putative DNA-directed RNA polymerase III subunit 22.9 kDa [Microthyrium microscopicum]